MKSRIVNSELKVIQVFFDPPWALPFFTTVFQFRFENSSVNSRVFDLFLFVDL
jgi:hypothetical protein